MFEERLQKVARRIGGVRGICLVAQDGISVESFQPDAGVDLEALSAELLTLVRRITDLEREPSVGPVRAFAVSGDRMTVLVRNITESYFLLVVVDDETRVGRARYELRRARLEFEKDLL